MLNLPPPSCLPSLPSILVILAIQVEVSEFHGFYHIVIVTLIEGYVTLHYAVWGRCFPDFAFPSQRKVDMYRVVVLLQNLSQLLFPVSLIEKAETSIKCWELCISLNTCTT